LRETGGHPHRRRRTISRRAALLMAAGAAVTLAGCARDYVWHARYTVAVQTPDGVKTGSSVLAYDFEDRSNVPLARMGDVVGMTLTGEAVVVDLGHGKYLFLLAPRAKWLPRGVVSAWLGRKINIRKLATRDPAFYGKPMPIPRKDLPLLVTFADITDPRTVRRVDPDNLAAAFGPGYRLKSVTLEITGEPVTKGRVEKVLGWLTWSREKMLKYGNGKNPVKYKYRNLVIYLDDPSFIRR